jgi:hypothetical protein
MAVTKIAAIMRAAAYSPNHIGNDAAILNAVADQLRKRGIEVHIYSEEHFMANDIDETIIIGMCRDPRSIEKLQRAEDAGRIVINSGYGIENCTRERLTRILVGSNIPYPESFCTNTNEVVKDRLRRGGYTQCWIKRSDTHAMHKEDVSYVRHPDEAQEVLQEYFLRGIDRAVISKHISGDLVKFYGVQGQPFFYWFCPFVANGGTYGCQSLNEGGPDAIKAMGKKLRTVCLHAAEELNVQVYGGDCVILPDGTISIISFNDWPSFAPCRAEAAASIAKSVLASIKEHQR